MTEKPDSARIWRRLAGYVAFTAVVQALLGVLLYSTMYSQGLVSLFFLIPMVNVAYPWLMQNAIRAQLWPAAIMIGTLFTFFVILAIGETVNLLRKAGRTKNRLLVVGGRTEIALAFVCMLLSVFRASTLLTGTNHYQDLRFHLENVVGIVGLAAFPLGYAGAVSAFGKRRLGLAVTGPTAIMIWAVLSAELATFTPGSSDMLIEIIFSIIALALSTSSLVCVVASRKEFRKEGVKP